MPDRAPDTHSAPATSSLAQKITEVKSRERRSAVSFLRDTVGCLIRETPIPHLQRVIADGIKIFCDFGKEQVIVQINGYDLGHTVTGFQFRYLGQRDFPVCSLVFKPRALAIDSEAPVFREDEYLMRAGIVLVTTRGYLSRLVREM
jgi:hypothetical protein